MSASFVQSVWTIVAMSFFIGVVIWAWSGNRKEDFDEASRLPLDDNNTVEPKNQE